MAGTPAAVGDYRRRALHDRFPIRVGHVGDQHVTGLQAIHLLDARNHPRSTRPDLLTDGTAFGQHLALFLQLETLDDLAVAALHCLGPRLHDVELAIITVARPFDVHRAAIVGLDGHRDAAELLDFLIADREALTALFTHFLGHHAMAGGAAGRCIDHLQMLAADIAPQDGALTGRQRRLVDVELVGINCALHHHFTQAITRGNEHHVTETGLGVEREQHAAGADVTAHHALDTGRQGHCVMVVALMHAIGDRAVVEQRGEYLMNFQSDLFETDHVQEGLLLAGKGRLGQIFCGRRRAHRDRERTTGGGGHVGIGLFNRGLQPRRQRRFDYPGADLAAGLGQRRHVIDIQRREALLDARVQALVREKIAEGLRGGREAARHAHAGRIEMANHFAQ